MGAKGKAAKRAAWERGIYHNLTMISGVPGGKPRRRHKKKQSTNQKRKIAQKQEQRQRTYSTTCGGYRRIY